MATVIYEPRDDRWGEIGRGIETGVANYMKRKQEEDDKKKLADILSGVQQAPDRETALGIVAASASQLRDPTTVSLALRLVDEAHPLADNSLVQGKVYDKATGSESPFWFKRADVDKVKDPNFIAESTGRDPSTFTMDKPAKIFDYVDPETGVSIGTFVPGMQPRGVITSQDFQRNRQLDMDERAIKAQERANEALEISKKNTEISEKRLGISERNAAETARHNRVQEAKSAKKDSAEADTKRVSLEQNRLKGYLVTQYGGRTLADGSLDLSSLDEPKRQKFTQEFDIGSEMLETGKAKTWGEAVRKIHKQELMPKSESGPDITGARGGDKPPALPKGAKVDSTVQTIQLKDGRKVRAKKVLDASGKPIGWQPVE
jgi:hypothetical protein